VDELDTGDGDPQTVQQLLEVADERGRGGDLLTPAERGCGTGSGLGAWDLAGIGRAQLEGAVGDVDADRIVEAAADELGAGDEWLGRLHVLLDEADAVDRFVRPAGREVLGRGLELGMGVEATHTEALAALIVLGDERRSEVPGRLDQRPAAERRRSPLHVEAVPGQRTVLTDLAHLEFEDPTTVDDTTSGCGEPVEDRPAEVLHMRVRARVRRGR